EGGVRVVADIEEAVRVDRVRGSLADLEVRREGCAAVRGVRGPDLEVVVGDSIGVSAPAGAEVVSGVVPGKRNVAARLVAGYRGVALPVAGAVVIQHDRRGPGGSVVV